MQLSSSRGVGSGRSAASRAPSSSRRTSVRVRADKCLITTTKGGGHAFISLYLARELLNKGHDVTIFQQGDQVRLGRAIAAQWAAGAGQSSSSDLEREREWAGCRVRARALDTCCPACQDPPQHLPPRSRHLPLRLPACSVQDWQQGAVLAVLGRARAQGALWQRH
jgi:hypothetical protein